MVRKAEDRNRLRECFRKACLAEHPQRAFVQALREAEFIGQEFDAALARCIPDGVCRHCYGPLTEETLSIGQTYWSAFWVPYHKDCQQIGQKAEAIDCQIIDADCNDCKHFQRVAGSEGHCLKHDRPTKAFPNFCSGWPCFEHRKASG